MCRAFRGLGFWGGLQNKQQVAAVFFSKKQKYEKKWFKSQKKWDCRLVEN
jgi:hypothetical protein